MIKRFVSSVLVLSAVFLPRGAPAQEVNLGKPLAEIMEPLSFLSAVHELPDGRVMLADPLAQEFFILDMNTGERVYYGREGQGPMEFRQPDSVWPYPGGASLLVDLGNARLTEVAPDGTFGATHSLIIGTPGPGSSMVMLLPQGVDAEGGVYTTVRGAMRPGAEDEPNPSAVVRVDLPTQRVDTITMLRPQDLTVRRSGQNISMRLVPLSPVDAWGVALDGSVVVARSVDYHLEWHHPDGSVTRGAPVAYDPVRIGTPEKRAWAANRGGGIMMDLSMGDGAPQMSVSRRGRGRSEDEPDLTQWEWPDRMTAFDNSRINVDWEGRAWVRRNARAGEVATYDVFGSDAELITTVALPEERRLTGFGDGVLYVTYNDQFDLVYLEKYALPML